LKAVGATRRYRIELNNEYPCPCCQGRLRPIVLTEAFGCDRCQQIFVVEQNQEILEQLSPIYPHKRRWQWTGKRWQPSEQNLASSYFSIALAIIVILLLIWLPLALHFPVGLNIIFWALVAVILAIIPALIVWSSGRTR
jgi:hypothetical protein